MFDLAHFHLELFRTRHALSEPITLDAHRVRVGFSAKDLPSLRQYGGMDAIFHAVRGEPESFRVLIEEVDPSTHSLTLRLLR